LYAFMKRGEYMTLLKKSIYVLWLGILTLLILRNTLSTSGILICFILSFLFLVLLVNRVE